MSILSGLIALIRRAVSLGCEVGGSDNFFGFSLQSSRILRFGSAARLGGSAFREISTTVILLFQRSDNNACSFCRLWAWRFSATIQMSSTGFFFLFPSFS